MERQVTLYCVDSSVPQTTVKSLFTRTPPLIWDSRCRLTRKKVQETQSFSPHTQVIEQVLSGKYHTCSERHYLHTAGASLLSGFYNEIYHSIRTSVQVFHTKILISTPRLKPSCRETREYPCLKTSRTKTRASCTFECRE